MRCILFLGSKTMACSSCGRCWRWWIQIIRILLLIDIPSNRDHSWAISDVRVYPYYHHLWHYFTVNLNGFVPLIYNGITIYFNCIGCRVGTKRTRPREFNPILTISRPFEGVPEDTIFNCGVRLKKAIHVLTVVDDMMDKRLHKLSLKGYALCKNKTGINRNYIILGKKKAARIRVAQTVEKPQFCV